jgi:7-cyano-7-deazaguanine reductase
MTDAGQSLLGKETEYDQVYSPELLFPLSRAKNRESLNIGACLPFHGEDKWTCFELSWLNTKGKPEVAIGYFDFPADSDFMIESKSFKLYLNSMNHSSFESEDTLRSLLVKDLSHAAGASVKVEIVGLASEKHQVASLLDGAVYIDDIEASDFEYQPNAGLLDVVPGAEQVTETLCSHLLRSNCPVTGQPDWGSVYIHYSGLKIDREKLLKYIVSFRQCQDFHEHCVERIFTDLMARCRCDSLSVYARYTRRGGLDINPYRATPDLAHTANQIRTARQ